jgi:hypothetical protein
MQLHLQGTVRHCLQGNTCHNVPSMFPQCSLNVPSMFPECSLNVPSMFPQCSLMFPSCSPKFSLTLLANCAHSHSSVWMCTSNGRIETLVHEGYHIMACVCMKKVRKDS